MPSYELPNWSVAEYVIPVVNVQSSRRITLHGTAFFLNSTGVFMTAGHVIRSAQEDAARTNGTVAVAIPVSDMTAGADSLGRILKVNEISLADAPYDIAVGTTNTASKALFRLAPSGSGSMLRNVITFGYPASALGDDPRAAITLGLRAHKGYIVRTLASGRLLAHDHPAAFELNFAVPSAMSGAPLLLEPPATWLEAGLQASGGLPFVGGMLVDTRFVPPPALHLLGVCVGTQEAETVVHAFTEVKDGEIEYREKMSKVELYGLAHDIASLATWKPSCLGGSSLGDVIKHSNIPTPSDEQANFSEPTAS